MRSFSKMALAFTLVAVATAPAMAQQGRGRGFGGGFGGGGAMLLSNKGVQQELKVSDAQAEKLNALAEDMGQKMRDQFGKLQDVPQDERREKMAEISRSMNADLRKSVGEILKADQVKRFEQIQVQQAGLAAFTMPRVEEELKLSADQKSKIGEIAASNRQGFGGGGGGGQRPSEEAIRKMQETRKENLEKALAVLNDDQKKTWKDLTGEPFEVRFERRGGNNNN